MGKYIIAVKRGKEKLANPEWTELVRKIANVEVLNSYRNKRIVISADEDGVLQIKNELSPDEFHIESLIEHRKPSPYKDQVGVTDTMDKQSSEALAVESFDEQKKSSSEDGEEDKMQIEDKGSSEDFHIESFIKPKKASTPDSSEQNKLLDS